MILHIIYELNIQICTLIIITYIYRSTTNARSSNTFRNMIRRFYKNLRGRYLFTSVF